MRRSLLLTAAGLLVNATFACAQRDAEIVETLDGEPVYQVLPAGTIPAIDDPEFLTVSEGDNQMKDDEPVLGVVMGGEARAYSLWHLDAHEIVNDRIGETAFAVTW